MGISTFPSTGSGGGASFGSYKFPAADTSYPVSITKGAYTLKNTTTSASVTYTFISSAGYTFTAVVANGFGHVVLPIDIVNIKSNTSGITLEYYASTYSVMAAPSATWAWSGSSGGNQTGNLTFTLASGATDLLVYWTDGTNTDLTSSSPANGVTVYPTVQTSGVSRNMLVVAKDAAGELSNGLVLNTGATTQGFNYLTFNSSTTWTVPTGVTSVDVLVAGGGGSYGNGYYYGPYSYGNGGQGGAGGYRYLTNQSVTPGDSINIVVGAAGTLSGFDGTRGGNSSFGAISATGGGGSRYGSGGSTDTNFQGNGGSGGGAGSARSSGYTGGYGNLGGYSPVEGYNGGNSVADSGGGGGGGAGGAASGGTNGIGVYNSITGTSVYYCVGGGGGANTGSANQNGTVRVRYFG